jgi:hypothetical protein
MVHRFANDGRIVMAAQTRTDHLRMIHFRCQYTGKGRGGYLMTRITQGGGIDMCRRFTNGDGAIVTGNAVCDKAGMVRHATRR